MTYAEALEERADLRLFRLRVYRRFRGRLVLEGTSSTVYDEAAAEFQAARLESSPGIARVTLESVPVLGLAREGEDE